MYNIFMKHDIKMRAVTPKTYKEQDKIEGYDPNKKKYPIFNLSLVDFPEAKEWSVDNTYVISMKVRQDSLHIDKGGKGRVSFEILAIGGEEYKESPAKSGKRYSRT